MRPLVDFLNHGQLPFVGRGDEVRRLIKFWRETFDASELRAMLVIGEAGVGKSRLVEETIPQIVAAGGAVVHLRLYPESTTSIVSLIAQALQHPDAGRNIIGHEIDPTPSSVTAGLRRLSRLRATLMVIEDIHLLNGGAVREFSQLLNALAEETLSLLCLARPVELEARGVLERSLVEELSLYGLSEEQCAQLWEETIGSKSESNVTEALYAVSTGNPLALRSALRGALKSGAVNAESGRLKGAGDMIALSQSIRKNVGLLAEGMTAHLSEDELAAAQQLAVLGEVFSREAADEMMAGNAAQMLDLLLFKGIIVRSTMSAQPITNTASQGPLLAFTHTLMHRHIVEHGKFDAERLLRVIARELPLYSVVPFHLLRDQWMKLEPSPELMFDAINQTLWAGLALDGTSDWRLATDMCEAASGIAHACGSLLDEQRRRQIDLQIIKYRLSAHRRAFDNEYRELVDTFLRLTEPMDSDPVRLARVDALHYLMELCSPTDYSACLATWQQIIELVEHDDLLHSSRPYAISLEVIANAANSHSDTTLLRSVEKRFHDFLSIPNLSEDCGRLALARLGPHLLSLFSNEEELKERMQLLAQLEALEEDRIVVTAGTKAAVMVMKAHLLMTVGHLQESIAACDLSLPIHREQGTSNEQATRMVRLCASAGFGCDLQSMVDEAEEIIASLHPVLVPNYRLMMGDNLSEVGLLRGDAAWTKKIIERFGIPESNRVLADILTTTEAGSRQHALQTQHCDDPATAELRELLSVPNGDERREGIYNVVRQNLKQPLLTLRSLLYVRLYIEIAESFSDVSRLESEIHDALVRSLGWLEDRVAFAYMEPYIEHYPSYFAKREVKEWKETIEALRRKYLAARAVQEGDGRIRITLLGTIAAFHLKGTSQRFQGARVRQLLAMMVINQMLDTPLEYGEFARLTAGGDVGIENARNILKNTVHRLRESLGHEAILTDKETPRLNLEMIHVDIIDVDRLIKKAQQSLRHGSLMGAKAALMEALEITQGEVAFPSLYDDFIEAAREEFESRLRRAVMDLSTGLIREGGYFDAEEIVRQGSVSMPGDEELAELLQDLLVRQGKRIDAQRVKLKTSDK